MLVADLTAINFNVLFELGFACGLSRPVLPIRDLSYSKDAGDLDELGFLDTLGYGKFHNSDDITTAVLNASPRALVRPLAEPLPDPIFLVLPLIITEGVRRTRAALNRSAFRSRVFDPKETPRMSFADISRQVGGSIAVVLPMLHPDRDGARVHNARCAFVAGMALAAQKQVLLLQEGNVRQPIDYRDLAVSYTDPSQVDGPVSRLVRHVATAIQKPVTLPPATQRSRLARLDLGDPAAENEEHGLMNYFVPTAQANSALRGQARLVIGRKGTGKSAIFHYVLHKNSRGQKTIVLDLRPEGYQLRKLVDLLEPAIGEGMREQTLATFWDYMLLTELAAKILDHEVSAAHRDPILLVKYQAVQRVADPLIGGEQGDFSERLALMLNQLDERILLATKGVANPALANVVWTHEIRPLRDAVANYLDAKEEIWILIDNLDRGWPARGARPHDILLLRCLLTATRKLQKEMQRRKVAIHTVVFLRNDVFERLVDGMPDRGKESRVSLDNSDAEVLQEIIRQRAVASLGEEVTFPSLWSSLFDRHVGGEDSFRYLLRHTFFRPRDILALVRKSADIAINRGHERVEEEDMKAAVTSQSNDVLRDLMYEVRDTQGAGAEVIQDFFGVAHPIPEAALAALLERRGVTGTKLQEARDLLLWYCFLGIRAPDGSEVYSFQFDYDLMKIRKMIEQSGPDAQFVIHPSFRAALEIN
jgi:hypothetical protein